MAWAWTWHGKCESDTAALCKSNGKDTFETLSGTAWQGNSMDAAWERHAMCESALMFPPKVKEAKFQVLYKKRKTLSTLTGN